MILVWVPEWLQWPGTAKRRFGFRRVPCTFCQMNIVRWVILVAILFGIGWLHFFMSQPKLAQPAVPSSIRQLYFLDSGLIAASATDNKFYVWSQNNLHLPRAISSGLEATGWPDGRGDVAFYRRSQLRRYDLASGSEKLSVKLHHNSSVAGYDPSTNEVFERTTTELRAYDANSPPAPLPGTRLLYPPENLEDPGAASTPSDLRLLRGPGDAFAVYDNGKRGLWAYFPGRDTRLRKIGDLSRTPKLLWATDGDSFVYQSKTDGHVRVVTPVDQHDWPAPRGSGSYGRPKIKQLTKNVVLFEERNNVHLHDIVDGAKIRSLEFQALQSLPAPDRRQGESVYSCGFTLSDNAQFFLLNCEFRKQVTTSVTDLSTMQSTRIERNNRPNSQYMNLLVTDAGASLFGHSNTIEFVKAGSSERLAVVNPEITVKQKPQRGGWIYRGLMALFVLLFARSMSVSSDHIEHARKDGGASQPVVAQFFAFKTMLFVVVPIGLLYVWFAYELVTGEHANTGMMSPGIAVALIGIALLGAIAVMGRVAMFAASIGSSVAQALGARSADSVVITSVFVYFALLFLPLWF